MVAASNSPADDPPAQEPAAHEPASRKPASRDLAVVLHDLAWLLPRTVGLEAARQDPLPQSELEVMRLLVRRPGLSVNDVARELGMQPSNASTAIRLLIARGTLERQADRADGRVVRLYPTRAAYAARDRRERSWGEALASVLDGLGASDRQRLAEAAPALRLLAARLAGEAAPGPAPGRAPGRAPGPAPIAGSAPLSR
jgi:DNA-binding MarR family transcriptional regulator